MKLREIRKAALVSCGHSVISQLAAGIAELARVRRESWTEVSA